MLSSLSKGTILFLLALLVVPYYPLMKLSFWLMNMKGTFPETDAYYGYFITYTLTMTLIVAGVISIVGVKRMSLSSSIGKFFLFHGISLFALGLGFAGFYYFEIIGNFPYPSFSDWLNIVYVLFAILSVYYLIRLNSTRLRFRNLMLTVAISLFFGLSIFYIINVAASVGSLAVTTQGIKDTWTTLTSLRADDLVTLFDLLYSITDAILVIVTVLLTGLIGGRMFREYLWYLISIITLISADVFFFYRDTVGTYYLGDFSDWIYIASCVLFVVATYRFLKLFDVRITTNNNNK